LEFLSYNKFPNLSSFAFAVLKTTKGKIPRACLRLFKSRTTNEQTFRKANREFASAHVLSKRVIKILL